MITKRERDVHTTARQCLLLTAVSAVSVDVLAFRMKTVFSLVSLFFVFFEDIFASGSSDGDDDDDYNDGKECSCGLGVPKCVCTLR